MRRALVIALGFLIVLLMGCGSNYKEYYQKVHEDLLVKQIAPLNDEYVLSLNEAQDLANATGDNIPPFDNELKAKYDVIAKKLEGIKEELKKYSPPDEFKEPHQRLVAYLDKFAASVTDAQKAAGGDVEAGKKAREPFKDAVVKCPKCDAENYIDKDNYFECMSCKAELVGAYDKLPLPSQLILIDNQFYGKKTVMDNR